MGASQIQWHTQKYFGAMCGSQTWTNSYGFIQIVAGQCFEATWHGKVAKTDDVFHGNRSRTRGATSKGELLIRLDSQKLIL